MATQPMATVVRSENSNLAAGATRDATHISPAVNNATAGGGTFNSRDRTCYFVPL